MCYAMALESLTVGDLVAVGLPRGHAMMVHKCVFPPPSSSPPPAVTPQLPTSSPAAVTVVTTSSPATVDQQLVDSAPPAGLTSSLPAPGIALSEANTEIARDGGDTALLLAKKYRMKPSGVLLVGSPTAAAVEDGVSIQAVSQTVGKESCKEDVVDSGEKGLADSSEGQCSEVVLTPKSKIKSFLQGLAAVGLDDPCTPPAGLTAHPTANSVAAAGEATLSILPTTGRAAAEPERSCAATERGVLPNSSSLPVVPQLVMRKSGGAFDRQDCRAVAGVVRVNSCTV